MQVVKKGKVQLQNRLVPDAPVHDWSRRIEDLQPDIDRVVQVGLLLCWLVTQWHSCTNLLI